MSKNVILLCGAGLVIISVVVMLTGVVLGHDGMYSTGAEVTKTVFTAMVGALTAAFGSKG